MGPGERENSPLRGPQYLPLLPVLVLLGVVSFVLASQASAQNWGIPVWSDEFNGAKGTPVDITKWKFETGNHNGWGNNELEVYCTPASATPAPCDPSNPNAFLDGNGNLVIQAVKTRNGTTTVWTSARMKTLGLADFEYGRVEARMKLPVGAGLWPAFWMLGSNIGTVGWPRSGEIDLMENVPATAGLGPTVIRSTIHGPTYFGAKGLGQDFTFPGQGRVDDRSYHVYGAIWSPNMIQFYVDDWTKPFCIRTAVDVPGGTAQWVFNHRFFVLLNLAVGGNWPGNPDGTTLDPAPMLVDYVRVYQARKVTGPRLTGSSVALKAGTTGRATIRLHSARRSGRVYLGCSLNAPKSTCSVSTGYLLNASVVDFSSSSKATATLTVTTTANSALPPFAFKRRVRFRWPTAVAGFLLLLLVLLSTRSAQRLGDRTVGAGVVLFGVMMVGFGGSGASAHSPPPADSGTPPGSYTITVIANAVSGEPSTVTIPLTVY